MVPVQALSREGELRTVLLIVLINSLSYLPGNGHLCEREEPTETVRLKNDLDITLIITTVATTLLILFIDHSRSLPSTHQAQKLLEKIILLGGKLSLYKLQDKTDTLWDTSTNSVLATTNQAAENYQTVYGNVYKQKHSVSQFISSLI